jgi:hypothetical protein
VLERALAVAREWNQTYKRSAPFRHAGYAYAMSGRTAEGIALLERGLGFLEAMGHRVGQPNFMVFLGEACALAGPVRRRRRDFSRAPSPLPEKAVNAAS